MLFQPRTLRSVLLTKFYSVTAFDTISDEVISSYYDTILFNISSDHVVLYPQLILMAAILYTVMYNNHTQIRRLGYLFENSNIVKRHIRGAILVLFLLLSRNVQNAI